MISYVDLLAVLGIIAIIGIILPMMLLFSVFIWAHAIRQITESYEVTGYVIEALQQKRLEEVPE